MRTIVFILSVFTPSLYAILPLPYPIEPWDREEDRELQETLRDPKNVVAYSELHSGGMSREMELPSFDNPPDTIGYLANEMFAVPPELKGRVDFWKKIYTEYTSDQAVVHDQEYPEINYGVMDISAIMNDPSLSWRKKMKAINKQMKVEKEKIKSQLFILHANQNSPINIPIELFSLFKKFESIREEDKFLMATQRIRVQIGQRDKVVQGFFNGGRYLTRMMEIFEKKKVPKELTRLPLVESAFNLAARSKVGASGVWQFMRSTGKRYLRVDKAVDERNDPITAASAAAELLRQNYEALGTWPLAITAYNHGREGVAKAVRILATNHLPTIIKKYRARTFGFASSNFFAEFLAILETEREYRKHFGKLMVDSPIEYEEFLISHAADFDEVASACHMTERELASMNPALTDWVISGKGRIPEGFKLKVPPNNYDKCKSGFRNVSKYPRTQKYRSRWSQRRPRVPIRSRGLS